MSARNPGRSVSQTGRYTGTRCRWSGRTSPSPDHPQPETGIHWLVDWLIGWLAGWLLIDWLFDWLIDWLFDCLLTDYLIAYWLTIWLIIDWLFDWFIDWLFDWLPDWLVCWLVIYTIPKPFLGTEKCFNQRAHISTISLRTPYLGASKSPIVVFCRCISPTMLWKSSDELWDVDAFPLTSPFLDDWLCRLRPERGLKVKVKVRGGRVQAGRRGIVSAENYFIVRFFLDYR